MSPNREISMAPVCVIRSRTVTLLFALPSSQPEGTMLTSMRSSHPQRALRVREQIDSLGVEYQVPILVNNWNLKCEIMRNSAK